MRARNRGVRRTRRAILTVVPLLVAASLAACGDPDPAENAEFEAQFILDMMPTGRNLPEGWTSTGAGGNVVDPWPQEGAPYGMCDGKSTDALGVDVGLIYVVESPFFFMPTGNPVQVRVLAFPSAGAAVFFKDSIPRSCTGGPVEVPEFLVELEDGEGGTWVMTDEIQSYDAPSEDGGLRHGMRWVQRFESADACAEPCTVVQTVERIFEMDMFGSVVFVTSVFGTESAVGVANPDTSSLPPSEPALVEEAALALVPDLRVRMADLYDGWLEQNG